MLKTVCFYSNKNLTLYMIILIYVFLLSASDSALKRNKKQYSCSVCKRKFSNRTSLCSHKNIHKKSHQCKVCLKCFGTKYHLSNHMKTHTGEKPYVCSICDLKLTRKDQYKDIRQFTVMREN